MAPDIDGKLYLTDIEVPASTNEMQTAQPGDVARVQITKTDAYDLVGHVVEILPRPEIRTASHSHAAHTPPGQLTRISTGAALRVLG